MVVGGGEVAAGEKMKTEGVGNKMKKKGQEEKEKGLKRLKRIFRALKILKFSRRVEDCLGN